jgi:predicted ABC-type ATPase
MENKNKLDSKTQKFLDAVTISDNSIKLEDLTVEATEKGNWIVYNKGKYLKVLSSKMLDEKTIRKNNLEHNDEYKNGGEMANGGLTIQNYKDEYGDEVKGFVSNWNKGLGDFEGKEVVYFVKYDDLMRSYMIGNGFLVKGIIVNTTEAGDDYFANEKDALKVAENLAQDEFYGAEDYYKKGGEIHATCEIYNPEGERAIDPKNIEKLTDCVMRLPQTKFMHFSTDTDQYTTERKKLHKKIIYDIKKDVVCVNRKQPVAILMGGSPASGKSTFLKKYRPYLLGDEILKIDADEVRAKLPEYKGYNATQTHLETKDIVNLLISDRNIGLPCNFDLIYDGTMNNTKSYLPLINLLKSLGYKIYVVYIDKVDKDVIVDRALKRYQGSGRFVPLEVIEDFFTKGKTALEEIKKNVDGYMIVDGSTPEYKLIEKGGMELPKDRNYSKIGSPINIDEENVVKNYKEGGEIEPDDKKTKDMITHKSGSAGGMLVGKRHSEGGIKAINKSTGDPLEMEGGEVVITRNAVSDNKKHDFEGEMLTNRQILSRINESGGGVSFEEGGEIHECACKGKSFNYGGKIMTDYKIVEHFREKYPDDFKKGVNEELSEHKETFKKIKSGKITYNEAGELIVAEHLKKKPNYYKMYSEGGMITLANKKVPSLDEFLKVGEPVKSPYIDENALYYKLYDMNTSKMMYFKNANKRSSKISKLLAYKTYLYDNYSINFEELPAVIQNGLTLGKQNLIDNYNNS